MHKFNIELMKPGFLKKLLPYIFLISLAIFVIGIISSHNNKKINSLNAEIDQCRSDLKQAKLPAISMKDLNLLNNKNDQTAKVVSGKMFFSFIKGNVNTDEYEIRIFLSGDPNTLADAADLTLSYTKGLKIDVASGDAFPDYPRKIVENGQIVITGVSSITNDNINFGKPGGTFAVLKVTIEDPEVLERDIKIDLSNSKIFYMAKDILDGENSFSLIQI
jgi:hypothetical protein